MAASERLVLAVALAAVLWPAPLLAQTRTSALPAEPPRVEWRPEWREFNWEDYLITSLAAGVVVGGQLWPEDPAGGSEGLPFDETARRVLRVQSERGELYARDASDVLMLAAIGYPFLVDSLTVALWHHQNPKVANELALISAETLAVTSALQTTVSGLTNRQRPYGRRCGDELSNETLYCSERNRYRSFFSGHTSISFASASVVCMHHANIPLYGGSGDQLVCALGFMNAAAVGTLRVASDQHYLSDVLMGAGIGTLTGLAVPWLLHYRPAERRGWTASLALRVVPLPGGVSVGGEF
ncbi:MAG TPA: phosphatase PAP2 family protein [Polyangiaceae bacterium]|nr:phosphatase PAP2 family protein [Polyangiaceae bacterium]